MDVSCISRYPLLFTTFVFLSKNYCIMLGLFSAIEAFPAVGKPLEKLIGI